MGDIIDNLKAATSGNPYTGSGTSDTQISGGQAPIMGSPDILRHSLDSNPFMSNAISLNEDGLTVEAPSNNDSR